MSASKFVEIRVTGGESEAACDQWRVPWPIPSGENRFVCLGSNWGRILAAIGRAGLEDLDTDAVSIHLNGVLIAEQGARAASYTEEKGQEAMASEIC